MVVAASNYPGIPRLGDVVTGAEGEGVLHAGTRRRDDGAVVSAGGRVLSVVGTGPDLAAARDDAYRRLAGVRLLGSHHRTDIALRAVEGKVATPAGRLIAIERCESRAGAALGPATTISGGGRVVGSGRESNCSARGRPRGDPALPRHGRLGRRGRAAAHPR